LPLPLLLLIFAIVVPFNGACPKLKPSHVPYFGTSSKRIDTYADGAIVPEVNQKAIFVRDARRDTSTNVAPDGCSGFRVLIRLRRRSNAKAAPARGQVLRAMPVTFAARY